MVFHSEAKTLAQAIRGAKPWREVGVSRAPAPVLYCAIPYVAASHRSSNDDRYWRAGFVWTIGWMPLSQFLIRRIGEQLGGPLTGKLAAIAPHTVLDLL